MGKNRDLGRLLCRTKQKTNGCSRCACRGTRAFRTPKSSFSPRSAEETWGVLEIEIIAGREESLLLARPASGVYLSREVLSRLAARGA